MSPLGESLVDTEHPQVTPVLGANVLGGEGPGAANSLFPLALIILDGPILDFEACRQAPRTSTLARRGIKRQPTKPAQPPSEAEG